MQPDTVRVYLLWQRAVTVSETVAAHVVSAKLLSAFQHINGDMQASKMSPGAHPSQTAEEWDGLSDVYAHSSSYGSQDERWACA